jgi:hypothetical protein
MRFQQQVIGRKIGVLALTQTNWPSVERHVLKIAEAVNEMTEGSYHELVIPTDKEWSKFRNKISEMVVPFGKAPAQVNSGMFLPNFFPDFRASAAWRD